VRSAENGIFKGTEAERCLWRLGHHRGHDAQGYAVHVPLDRCSVRPAGVIVGEAMQQAQGRPAFGWRDAMLGQEYIHRHAKFQHLGAKIYLG